MLGLLDAVEQDRAQSQRLLASELGIALGLVNAYLKRCVKKGLVKVRSAPARRYAYYLTPQGFAEKSRLTVEYLSYSFSFFRQAKTDCTELFKAASARNVESVLLAGQSDLAEIAALCAMEHGIKIAGVVQKDTAKEQFIGLPVFEDFDAVTGRFDAVLITDVLSPRETVKRRSRVSVSTACWCPTCCESACGKKAERANDGRSAAMVRRADAGECREQGGRLISPGRDLQLICRAILRREGMRAASKQSPRLCSLVISSSKSTWRSNAGVRSIRPSASRGSCATEINQRPCPTM